MLSRALYKRVCTRWQNEPDYFLRVPLACLGSWEQGSRAGTPMWNSHKTVYLTSLSGSFCHPVPCPVHIMEDSWHRWITTQDGECHHWERSRRPRGGGGGGGRGAAESAAEEPLPDGATLTARHRKRTHQSGLSTPSHHRKDTKWQNKLYCWISMLFFVSSPNLPRQQQGWFNKGTLRKQFLNLTVPLSSSFCLFRIPRYTSDTRYVFSSLAKRKQWRKKPNTN